MTINVLVADKIFDEGIRLLEEKGYQVKCVWDLPKAELSHLIADYDVFNCGIQFKADMTGIEIESTFVWGLKKRLTRIFLSNESG